MTQLGEAPAAVEPKADKGFFLRINGREYDATDFTLNEVEEIEDMCGGGAMVDLDFSRPKTLKAIVFVILRREDPNVTLEQAGNVRYKGLLPEDPTDEDAD